MKKLIIAVLALTVSAAAFSKPLPADSVKTTPKIDSTFKLNPKQTANLSKLLVYLGEGSQHSVSKNLTIEDGNNMRDALGEFQTLIKNWFESLKPADKPVKK